MNINTPYPMMGSRQESCNNPEVFTHVHENHTHENGGGVGARSRVADRNIVTDL